MDRARDMLRSGDWLTRERVRLIAVGAADRLGRGLSVFGRARRMA